MDRPLQVLTLLLSFFLLSQSHSIVQSQPSDRPEQVPPLPSPLRCRRRHHYPPPPQLKSGSEDLDCRPKKRKVNVGKKIGVMFLAIGVGLQVVVVGVLGFKRWQILKKMKERQWDFSAWELDSFLLLLMHDWWLICEWVVVFWHFLFL